MATFLIAGAVFMFGYLLNIFYITVLYHRALTHNAVRLTPGAMKFLALTGSWVTGIDPKAWACMHRLHHTHSDTPQDPHSPLHYGVLGVATAQLRSYQRTLARLIRSEPKTSAIVADIPFGVNFLNRKKLWILPYALHLLLGVVIGWGSGSLLIGYAYFLGIMSHPIQGWMVNSLAHKYGYRNHEIEDHSRNNWFVALAVFGEGYQNNHHAAPSRANFAHKSHEIDLGYGLCRIASALGFLGKQAKVPKAMVNEPSLGLAQPQ